MKYLTNEIVEAAERLRAAVHSVGTGECVDAEKRLLLLAAETPRDRDLLVAVAAECAYRVEEERRRTRAALRGAKQSTLLDEAEKKR